MYECRGISPDGPDGSCSVAQTTASCVPLTARGWLTTIGAATTTVPIPTLACTATRTARSPRHNRWPELQTALSRTGPVPAPTALTWLGHTASTPAPNGILRSYSPQACNQTEIVRSHWGTEVARIFWAGQSANATGQPGTFIFPDGNGYSIVTRFFSEKSIAKSKLASKDPT